MPAVCGDYILRTTLLNPTEEVKYPVVSEWDIRVLEAEVPAPLEAASTSRRRDERSPWRTAGPAHRPDPVKADLLLLSRASWEGLNDAAGRSKKPSPGAQAS